MKNREYYKTPESTKVMRLLWAAAGGDRYILERATYSDQIKYMCLGGIVFATGAMAALAGGYAFYTIFAPKDEITGDLLISTPYLILSMLFGIIWGLIIFNIDRFIVTSTGKGDGTEKITWDEFKSAIPRIIMGIIIAITISKPIEIRMFQSEIQSKIFEKKQEQMNIYVNKIDSIYKPSLASIQNKIDAFQAKIDQKYNTFIQTEKDWHDYTNLHQGTAAPQHFQNKEDAKQQWLTELKIDTPEINKLRIELQNWQQKKDIALNNAQGNADSLNGLLLRIKLSHEIAGFWITLFITLLFMAIELTPIFFKLMLTKTPYDYLSENRDDLIRAEHGIEVRYDYYKDKEGQERHLIINHEAERMIYEKMKVTEIQKNLTDYAASKYEEQEKKKIDENPNDYIA
jgi:hypothetical protein